MKSNAFGWMASMVLVLAASMGAVAQNSAFARFGVIDFYGQINAYSPQTGATGTLGPYEIRGPWSLKVNRNSGKADFSAAVNMELSDGWALTTNKDSKTPFDPNAGNAHTHHITLNGGDVTELPSGGFQVSGTGTVTLNGGPTLFAQQSRLTITVTGGTDPEFSNITLLFGAPASGHFGSEVLPGVVRSVQGER
jgi:hypothetical protein